MIAPLIFVSELLIFVSEFTTVGVRSSMGDIKLSLQNEGPGINSLLVAS